MQTGLTLQSASITWRKHEKFRIYPSGFIWNNPHLARYYRPQIGLCSIYLQFEQGL